MSVRDLIKRIEEETNTREGYKKMREGAGGQGGIGVKIHKGPSNGTWHNLLRITRGGYGFFKVRGGLGRSIFQSKSHQQLIS